MFEKDFTKATQLGVFPSGSAEWHQARAMGIGGSEIAAICGVSKWESAYSLWAKKTGRVRDDFKQSESMYWGSTLEAVIVDEFCKRHPELDVWRDAGTWHGKNIWELANPDALFRDEQGYGLIEVKTAAYFDDWNVPADGVRGIGADIPDYYMTQVQWYLRIFGLKRAIVVVLFGGNRYREFDIVADEFEQDYYFDMAQKFWAKVEADEKPDWDGSEATLNAVRFSNPLISDAQVDIDPELAFTYSQALDEFDFADAEVKKLKSQILDIMGEAKVGLVNGKPFVKRQSGKYGPFLVNVKG